MINRSRWLLFAALVAGAGIRLLLLPTPGYVGDIDQFVAWAGHISRDGLSHAYDVQLSFGPVMVLVWWVLGLLDPALAIAATGADPMVRVVMKLPAVAADLAIAWCVWAALRHRPTLAAAAVGVILLHPAIWFVGAWWGQYDAVYAACIALAYVFVTKNHAALGVVALVLGVMTKPQAAPLVLPFAAWLVARATWRGHGGAGSVTLSALVVAGICGIGTLVALWVPFLAEGGPANYLAALGTYQTEFYGFLSLHAWNLWWVVQELLANGSLVPDTASLVGPLTFRLVGFVITGALMSVIVICVARRPTPRMLAIGVGAAGLVAFEFLTSMHERYAFAVLPMLVFVLDIPRIRLITLVLGVTMFLNLVSAARDFVGPIIPVDEAVSVVAATINVVCALLLVLELVRSSREPEPAAAVNELDAGYGVPRQPDMQTAI